MEFLRFGSTIPGSYWGCCAVCIIQNFKFDPDAKASIQIVSGDGGAPIGNPHQYAGPTYRDIFKQRLRIGTFNTRDMPNHAFFAVLTESQINGAHGKAWLAILKEHGFEFIRTVDNSVYTGADTIKKPKAKGSRSPHRNHIFGLFRNIGEGCVDDPFTPPKAWTDLDKVKPEAWELLSATDKLAREQQEADLKVWDAVGAPKFLTEKELDKMGVPVTLAGLRSPNKQELRDVRQKRQATEQKAKEQAKPKQAAPFGKAVG